MKLDMSNHHIEDGKHLSPNVGEQFVELGPQLLTTPQPNCLCAPARSWIVQTFCPVMTK